MNGSISSLYTQMTRSFFLLKFVFTTYRSTFFGYLYCPRLTCRQSELTLYFFCLFVVVVCLFFSFFILCTKGQQQPSVSQRNVEQKKLPKVNMHRLLLSRERRDKDYYTWTLSYSNTKCTCKLSVTFHEATWFQLNPEPFFCFSQNKSREAQQETETRGHKTQNVQLFICGPKGNH